MQDLWTKIYGSLSNIVNNVAVVIRKSKCKCGHDNENGEMNGIKYKCFGSCLEYNRVKNDLIEHKFLKT